MAPLPRGTCRACGRDVAIRNGGEVREHARAGKYMWSGIVGAPRGIGSSVCPGSGKTPRDPRTGRYEKTARRKAK